MTHPGVDMVSSKQDRANRLNKISELGQRFTISLWFVLRISICNICVYAFYCLVKSAYMRSCHPYHHLNKEERRCHRKPSTIANLLYNGLPLVLSFWIHYLHLFLTLAYVTQSLLTADISYNMECSGKTDL